MAERGRTWMDKEIALLLAKWSTDTIQKQLQGKKRNAVAYKALSDALQAANFERTPQQCRDKIKSLKKRYKDIVDKQRRSGGGQESDDEITISDFPWFTEINRIMGDRAVANPPNILDSADHEDWTKGEEEDDLFSQSGLLTPSSIGNSRPVTPSEWPVTPSDTAGPSVKDTSLKHTVDTSLVQTADVIDCDVEGTSGDRQDEDGTEEPTSSETPLGSSSSATPSGTPSIPRKRGTTGNQSSKNKKKKVTKIEKAERKSAESFDKVIAHLVEERKRRDEVEVERRRLEYERAIRDERRDDQFLSLFGQFLSAFRPPQPQHLPGFPVSMPMQPMQHQPPQQEPQQPSSYGVMYHFNKDDENSDS